MAHVNLRIPDGMMAEIETLMFEKGMWQNTTEFFNDAVNEYISKYWDGARFDH